MSFDSQQLRSALGRFSTGVTVVTSEPEGFAPFGMTINSFSALSLDPPLVLWSLQKNSGQAKAWDVASHFAVNVLSAQQQETSQQYARSQQQSLQPDSYEVGSKGIPVLRDCIASFECELDSRVDAGDHTIIIGRVLNIDESSSEEPLIFYRGSYRALSQDEQANKT